MIFLSSQNGYQNAKRGVYENVEKKGNPSQLKVPRI